MKQTDRVWHWNSQKSGLVVLFVMCGMYGKNEKQKYHKVRTIPKSDIKNRRKGEIDSTISQIRTDLFTFRDWYRQINKKWRG
jgi:hypothetical protein